ncbi:MAG: hypothetical protein A3C51_06200 [Omnitrophica bacterium RIFCSPHIGHO2_02_FULL_46_20]|nr:MAG: hypothetical protein A3C51_06200 [Omnitrophica bacterium RIFCSPHIGHO2_02_FULL_46_20]
MIVSKRHKRLTLKTRVARKITEIPADDWNKVYPDILESYNFYKTLDEAGLGQFTLFYIVVYVRKNPVAATACFLVNYPLDTSISGPLRRVTNSIKKVMPNIFSLKAVICGAPMNQGKIGIAGDADAIMKAILRRMEQIAKKNKAPIVAFKDFDQTHTKILDPLQKAGFSKFDSLPTTILNVWFKDFEEYLMTLSSASRYDLRRKFRKVDGHVKIYLEIVDALEGGALHEVYKLYLDIVAKHDMNFELLPIEFFKKISINMPGHTKFFLWRIDGKLVMFLFGMASKDLFIDYYVGFDYSLALKYHLYFVKFRETLNWCIRHKIKQYEMGITGYEPKRRLGFDFIPLYLYVKLRNRMLRPIFNLICQFLKFENFDPALKKGKKQRSL